MPSSCPGTPSGMEALRSFNWAWNTQTIKTIKQVRKKTLLNKEEIACSEVFCLPSLFWIQDPNYSFQSCVLSWVAKKAGCHLDWFRSPFLFSWIKPDQLFLETIFQQLSHQWGQSLFTDRRCNQLSECLVKSPFGKSLPCFMSLSHFPGALVEAQRDDWLHATLLCQVGSL